MHEEMEGFAHGYGRGHGYGGNNINDDDVDEAVEGHNSSAHLSGAGKALASGDLFVPWRSAKLTRLLQGCLSAGAVALIVNVGPEDSSVSETLNSLYFGKRARAIPLNSALSTATSRNLDYHSVALRLQKRIDNMLDSARQSKSRYSNIKRSNEALRVALAEALARERKAKQALEEVKAKQGGSGAGGGGVGLEERGEIQYIAFGLQREPELTETLCDQGDRQRPTQSSVTVQMRIRKAGAVAAAAAAAAAARKQKATPTKESSEEKKVPWRSGGGIERKRSKGSVEAKEQEGMGGNRRKPKTPRKSPAVVVKPTAASLARKRPPVSRSPRSRGGEEKRGANGSTNGREPASEEEASEVERLRERLALQVTVSQGLQRQVEELIGDLSSPKKR